VVLSCCPWITNCIDSRRQWMRKTKCQTGVNCWRHWKEIISGHKSPNARLPFSGQPHTTRLSARNVSVASGNRAQDPPGQRHCSCVYTFRHNFSWNKFQFTCSINGAFFRRFTYFIFSESYLSYRTPSLLSRLFVTQLQQTVNLTAHCNNLAAVERPHKLHPTYRLADKIILKEV